MPSASHDGRPQSRFEFGENWRRFLRVITPERIARAEVSLREMLDTESLAGRSVLDVGCGSGLFSLAARSLRAKVYSFDYDPGSVACTRELRAQYRPDDSEWQVEQGSVLDAGYMARLPTFDVVYAWGVLHHTGSMWKAMELVANRVSPGGLLLVALYNDQGKKSRFWKAVKRTYARLPRLLKAPYAVLVISPFELRLFIRAVWTGTVASYVSTWTDYGRSRGMSRWYDLIDWVGGYPYEVARPDDVIRFYADRGFAEVRSHLTRDHGCNEFLFRLRDDG